MRQSQQPSKPNKPNKGPMHANARGSRTTKQAAPVNSLIDVDSPDDFKHEGTGNPLPSTDNKVSWVKVDNPDDFE